MKIFLKNFALMMAAIVSAVSCSEADVEDIYIATESAETVLYASTPNGLSTKVEFTDNDAEGIALAWEADDKFTVYNGDVEVGTFTCLDVESGKFRSDAVLTNGTTYTAKYGSADNIWEQNGDEINNLDAACVMRATFTYGNNETFTFEHEMATITFKFESEERPAKLIFENGAEVYTVLYSTIEPSNGIYTSHIMVNPCDSTERDLTFSLYDSLGTAYDIRTVTTSKAYVAGYRYTATVSDIEVVGLGSGTEDDPYLISTAEQLRQLAIDVNSGISHSGEYFLMTNNIDLGGIDADGNGIAENEFTAIGNVSDYFKGIFDGGGYEVSGLYINQPETSFQGLFGYTNNTIKNLGVSGSVSGDSYVGGVVGQTYGATITACYNACKVSGGMRVGGVVGHSYGWSGSYAITECYNTGEVSGSGSGVGGVVGYANRYLAYVTIASCYNTGKVSGSSHNVGGVAGTVGNYGTMAACYNSGEVSGSGNNIGGVAGYIGDYGTMTACYNSGEVLGDSEYLGGVVSSSSSAATITACYYLSTTLDSYYGTKVTSVSELNDAVAEMNSAAGAEYFTVNSGNILPSLLGEQIAYDMFAIGDVYDDGIDKGIIWWVADDGLSCKILAIEEGGDYKVVLTTVSSLWVDGCDDYSDGAANTAAIRQYAIDTYGEDNYRSYFPILEWIDEKSEGWYLPAHSEYCVLLPLYFTNSDYKSALTLYGDAIRSDYYWSSTISTTATAWAIKYTSATSHWYSQYGSNNTSGRYARRVKLITLNDSSTSVD